MTRPTARAGFTLIELLVALLIGSIVVALGRLTLESLLQLERSAGTQLSDANASGVGRSAIERSVSSAVASPEQPFTGTATQVAFRSRCPDAYGGFGPCDVQLSSTSGLIVLERLLDRSVRSVLVTPAAGHFDFVISAAGGGAVTTNWGPAGVAPLAVRWLPDAPGSADTLILPILRSAP